MTETRNAYTLARMAEVASPDNLKSAGAKWLESVASDWAEAVKFGVTEDSVTEIADQSVPVYTHTLWSVFVDLAAYSEDVSDHSDSGADMNQKAATALYQIAERLIIALRDEE